MMTEMVNYNLASNSFCERIWLNDSQLEIFFNRLSFRPDNQGLNEMCFFDAKKGIQARVSGKLEEISDTRYKDEILQHPSRGFLKNMKEQGQFKNFYDELKVFALKNGTAVIWTFASNLAPKEKISL